MQVDDAAPGRVQDPARPPGFHSVKTGKPCPLLICSSWPWRTDVGRSLLGRPVALDERARAAPRGRRPDGLRRNIGTTWVATACCRLGICQMLGQSCFGCEVFAVVRRHRPWDRPAAWPTSRSGRRAVTTGTSMARWRFECATTKPMIAGPIEERGVPEADHQSQATTAADVSGQPVDLRGDQSDAEADEAPADQDDREAAAEGREQVADERARRRRSVRRTGDRDARPRSRRTGGSPP